MFNADAGGNLGLPAKQVMRIFAISRFAIYRCWGRSITAQASSVPLSGQDIFCIDRFYAKKGSWKRSPEMAEPFVLWNTSFH